MITLALVGDVMLGRGVNDALRTLRPEQPWGDVLPWLVSNDLRIVNLECALTDHDQPWTRTPKVFHFRADPSAVEVLRAARVDCCSLANNHTLDFEERGLLDTVEHLKAAGIHHAGAGYDREEAARPAFLTTRSDRPNQVAMLALRWSDLVLDDPEPVARVRRSLSKDDGGRLVVKSTKTEKGRAVALLPQVVEALQAHRKRQAEQRLKYSGLWRDEELVFPSKTGGPMSWDNLVRRNLKPLMYATGLPETTRPYDLRHTFATLMLEQGENPKVVQEVLGHSRITHTMDTYSHVSPNIQKEAFGRLGKRLEGP